MPSHCLQLIASDDAAEIATRLNATEDPPHVELAELCLALGNKERALHHVLKGYKKAWADGPPHIYHWDLEACRKVLRTLGTAEPVLPPFDPKSVKPFDFEPALRALIAKKEAEKAEEDAKREARKGKPEFDPFALFELLKSDIEVSPSAPLKPPKPAPPVAAPAWQVDSPPKAISEPVAFFTVAPPAAVDVPAQPVVGFIAAPKKKARSRWPIALFLVVAGLLTAGVLTTTGFVDLSSLTRQLR